MFARRSLAGASAISRSAQGTDKSRMHAKAESVSVPPTGADPTLVTHSNGWVLRPILWFAAASMINAILHECAHAVTAYALGIRATLFSFSVDLDLAHAGLNERAWVGIAGPVTSLLVGGLCWFTYRRARHSAIGLPLVYLSAFGLSMFFGNLMSAAFVGDFSNVAVVLDMPPAARYAATLMGALSLIAILFWVGRELRQWAPAHMGAVTGVFGIIALPTLIGTAAVILINQPTPRSFVVARAAEASSWLVAGIGALVTRRNHQNRGCLGLRSADGVAAVLAGLVVRLMVRGIPVAP